MHLLVLATVLIYNAWNEKYVQYGAFVDAAMIFYSMRHDVLTQVFMKIMPCRLVKGYGKKLPIDAA
jgi:hypothetical protein